MPAVDEEMLNRIANEVVCEAIRATAKFVPFRSYHEGFAVLLEEVDELKAAVWSHHGLTSAKMREEAIQIAAMAIRFVYDLCDINQKYTRTVRRDERGNHD